MYQPIEGGTFEVISDLTCWIPPVPAPNKIGNHKIKDPLEQKWVREPLPDWWEERREAEKLIQEGDPDNKIPPDPEYVDPKCEAYRRRETERRANGYWFYNKGKPTYITGLHYFYLQWFRLDTGYPKYRESDRKIFYFWQYCREDPNCFGMLEISNRGNGKSYRAGCAILEPATRTKRALSGIQSKTDKDAQEFFLTKVAEPFKDLPDFFQPEYNHGTDPRSELSFFRPASKGKNAKLLKRSENQELRSRLGYRSSKEQAYDGSTLLTLIQDEVGKETDANVYERAKVNRLCVYRDGVMRGKIYATTTIEEAELEDGCKKLWRDSNQNKRNKVGQTVTGLYRLFLPAYEVNGEFTDEYGFCDSEKAREKYQAIRDGIEDPTDKVSEIRKNPFTIEEAFMVSGNACVFNAMYLDSRYQELDNPAPGMALPIQGNFSWVGEIDGEVEFVPDNVSGRFFLTKQYPKERTNRVLSTFRDGQWIHSPQNDTEFSIGTDPIMHGVVVENRKSNASAYAFEKFDIRQDDPNGDPNEWQSYNFCCEYIFRPEEPEAYIEDMIKMCRYFGCKVLAENQKNYILRYFRLRGYAEFIMMRPDNTKSENELYAKKQDTEGAPSSTPLIQQYTGYLQTFVNKHYKRMMFKRLIADMLKFKPLKPTEHDPTVAAGFTMISVHAPIYKMPDPIDVDDLFRTYDNRGTFSQLSA